MSVIFHFPYTNVFGFDFFLFVCLELSAKKICVLWYQLSLWQERPQIEGCETWSSGKEPPFHLVRPVAFWGASRAPVARGVHSGSASMSWLLSLSVGTFVHGVLVFVNLFSWFEFTKEWLIQNCLWQKYTLLWLYSSGSNIVMGLLGAENRFEL